MGEQDSPAPTSQQPTSTVTQNTAATLKSDTPDNCKEMTQGTTDAPAEQPKQQQPSAPTDGGQEPKDDQSIAKAKEEISKGQGKHDQCQLQSGQPQPGQPQPEPQAPVDNSHAPPIGTKIQVLWRIIHEDNNNNSTAEAMNTDSTNEAAGNTEATSGPMEEQRWWGAVVQERTSEKVGSRSFEAYKDLDVHILLYDAYGDFEEEVVRVAFLPDNVLLDLSMLDDADGGRLDWRLESDAMNDEDDEESATAVRSAECLAREADQIVQLSGISADADLQALARMPHEVQLHVASGYRSFADAIKSLLGELVASKPADYVVTAQDVQEIMARVRSQRQALTSTAAQ